MFTLDPINKKSKIRELNFAVADVESASWTKFLVVGYYDRKSGFASFKDRKDFFAHIFDRGVDTVFSHFGGKFDFLFFIDALLPLKRKYRMENLIPRGSRILCFDLVDRKTDAKVTFRDSSALLPFALRSLCETFKVDHQKLEIDYDKIAAVTPELIKYLEHDCRGLYEVMERFYSQPLIKRAGPAFTMASQSLRLLRTHLKRPIPSLGEHASEFVRSSYYGGRTEIFKPLFDGPGEIHCYDVNSLYPTVMQANDMPGGFDTWVFEYVKGRMGFYDVTVSVPDNQYIPPLPYMEPSKSRLIFPVGTFRGIWSSIELEYAKKLGIKILKIHKGCLFYSAGKIFKSFIDELYSIRLSAEKNSVDDILAKLLMNSSYGRFGLKLERENIVFDSGQEGFKPLSEISIEGEIHRIGKMDTFIESFTNVAIAAWVTSHARIFMHKIFMENPDSVYYTDTDSVFTTKKFPKTKGLGGLKHEYSVDQAIFLLPKTYIANSNKMGNNSIHKKVTMKGFDKKKIQHFDFEDFKHALEGDLSRLQIVQEARFATFKSALQKKKILTMLDATSRGVRSMYDKRTIIKTDGGYDTVPLKLDGSENNGKGTGDSKTGIQAKEA